MGRVRAAAAGVVMLLLLTGCAEAASLSEKAQIGFAMQEFESELDQLAGISTQYTAELQGDFSYVVRVHSTAPQLDGGQLLDVALAVQRQVSSGVLARTVASFDLVHDDAPLLSMSSFTATEPHLRDVFERAAAVGEAYGSPAAVSIDGTVAVGFSTASPSPDWQAIRAIVAGSPSSEYWGFPGLSWQGAMPPPAATNLVDAIGEVIPLGFTSDLYVSVDWYDETGIVTFAATGVDIANPTASTRWPQAVQVAALIERAGITGSGFMFYSLDAQGTATVTVGPCSELAATGDGDAALASALLATGALAAVEPGACTRA